MNSPKLRRLRHGSFCGAILLTALLVRPAAAQSPPWKELAFKENETGWQASEFGGDGKVQWNGASLILERGQPMTGIRWKGDFPKKDFEIQLEARRVEGDDFFVGLTFPVDDQHCSLILGGWAGSISGLSTINGADASENESSFFRDFENGTWYPVRLKVTADHIQAWVGDEQVVNQEREGRRFDVRIEVDGSLPLGLAAYGCKSEIRNFRYRAL